MKPQPKALMSLVDKISSEYGFQIARSEIEKLENGPDLTAQELADILLRLEGLDPVLGDPWLRREILWTIEDWYSLPRSTGRRRITIP